MSSVHVSENASGVVVEGSVVNGYIVYTRAKKARHLCNGSSENGLLKRLKTSVVDCNLELKSEPAQSLDGEGVSNGIPAKISKDSELQKNVVYKTLKQFTPSVLKPKVESSVKLETAPEAAQTANTEPDGKSNAALSALTTSRNKLELKMSKKPTTVKELFDTGLQDGVTVIYMGGKKASGLRGVIADGGILCSCCLCNGRRVIPPSQFEIHACKSYRRAAQYICLENGKSLLELLRACRAAPLHTLETTILNIVCSSPEEKYFTCKRCKGHFPSSCVERVGLYVKLVWNRRNLKNVLLIQLPKESGPPDQ